MNRWTFCVVCIVLKVVFCVNITVCSAIISRNGVEISYTITKSDLCQTDEHMIRHLFGVSMPDCVVECVLRQQCFALSYNHGMQRCLLLRSVEKSGIRNTKCDYIQRMDITTIMIPCMCKDGMVCDLKSRSCIVKECPYPSPIRGNVLGNNMALASMIQYTCHYGSIDYTGINNATCLQDGTWSYIANCSYIRDCADYYNQGSRQSGVYKIQLTSGEHFNVSCDMSMNSGGWIVIQRRISASDFYRNWTEYKNGFGDLDGNFWIGNEKIWLLTRTGFWKLRIDLTFRGQTGYAEYRSFAVENEASNYVLSVKGFTGNIGDSFGRHNGHPFTTKDRDNDQHGDNCAEKFRGGWWYSACHGTNLNGLYGSTEYGQGITWYDWKGNSRSMTTSEMKIKMVG